MRLGIFVLLAISICSCSGNEAVEITDAGQPDSYWADTAQSDAVVLDTYVPDAWQPDTNLPDAWQSDTDLPDAWQPLPAVPCDSQLFEFIGPIFG